MLLAQAYQIFSQFKPENNIIFTSFMVEVAGD